MTSATLIRGRTVIEHRSSDHTGLWIVVGVTAGIFALTGTTTLLLVLFFNCCRRRLSYGPVSSRRWPHLKFPTMRNKSGLSVHDTPDAELEFQRFYIIQKSLATRDASNKAQSDGHSLHKHVAIRKPESLRKSPSQNPSPVTLWKDQEECNRQNHQPEMHTVLAEDFKKWEARIRREGAKLLEHHPCLQ